MYYIVFESEDSEESAVGRIEIYEQVEDGQDLDIPRDVVRYRTKKIEEFYAFKDNWNLKDISDGEWRYIQKTVGEKFNDG